MLLRSINKCILLLGLLVRTLTGTAQHPDAIFRHVTELDGLLNNKVSAICQDHQGFLWIGTQAGLQRYDGSRFKNYLSDIRDTSALQSDWISCIFEDSKKRLWIGNDHGTPYLFDKVTEKFYNYNFHTSSKYRINGIWHFAEDNKGAIWIAGHEGYFRLDDSTNRFVKYNNMMGLDSKIITGSITPDGNYLWMATTSGLRLYDQVNKKLYNKEYNPTHNPVFDIKESISNILAYGNYLWMGTGNDKIVYKYNFITQKLKAYSFDKLPSKKMGRFKKEGLGPIFLLQDGKVIVPLLKRGLAIYQPSADSFDIIETDNTKGFAYHLNQNLSTTVTIIEDNEKNILIGNEAGINIYNPKKQYFETIRPGNEKQRLFPDEPVSDILELENGNILFSYYNVNGGIVKTDNKFKFIKHYLYKERGNPNSAVNQSWLLFKNEDNKVWSPNQDNSILQLDLNNDKLVNLRDSTISGPFNIIKQGSQGVIWMGHWSKGLISLSLPDHNVQYYSQFLNSDVNTFKRVYALLFDSNKIWVGTFQSGLQLFDTRTGKFIEAYYPDQKSKTAISSNSVFEIIRHNVDTLLLATEMGVNIFDVKRKKFTAITVKEGLPTNFVISIIKDDNNYLWAACSGGGFCKINLHTLSVTPYDINDGITDNDFISKFCRLKSGNMLIGASGSFISFDPMRTTNSSPPPDVRITDLHIFDKEILVDSFISANQPLMLTYTQNSLHIQFASLQYWSPWSIKYYYKLEGTDKEWLMADKTNTAIYNQLPNGKYVFKVKCINREGFECTKTTQLQITIQAPYWKTWWFILLMSILIASLFLVVIKAREKNLKAIYGINALLSKARLEALRSQMNPHFIFNSLNAIQECILTNKVDAAYEYLSKFSKLQRMVLNNSVKELIPLSSEIEMLELYLSLESLRFNKSFSYKIDTIGIQDIEEVMIPSLITQPFVENAIWHGLRSKEGEKKLTITYEELQGKIVITIDDNGIGREAAALIRLKKLGNNQLVSKGTMIVKERFDVLSQQYKADINLQTIDKKYEDGNTAGTRIIISFSSNLIV